MPTLPPFLRTGQTEMDRDHARLFALEANLASVCAVAGTDEPCERCDPDRQRQCDHRISHLLEEFIGLAASHFRNEERHMVCLSQDEAQRHKYEHAEIASAFARLVAQNRDRPMIARPSEISLILHDWLDGHIVQYDLDLARRIQMATSPGRAA
ncbi:MAG: hemerythrin family protein [Thiobacillus sp.]|nr:hemerythrin family protein [Thiobacillus sp.]